MEKERARYMRTKENDKPKMILRKYHGIVTTAVKGKQGHGQEE